MIDEAFVRRLLEAPGDALPALRGAQLLNAAGLSDLIGHAGRLAGSAPESALGLLDIAEVAAPVADAEVVVADSRYLRARLTLEAGQPAEALPLIASAREAYERLGLRGEALRTELGRMHALDDLGRHAEAVEVGRALLGGLDDAGAANELAPLRASALSNLGVALGFTGRHDQALWCYVRSEAIWSRLGEEEAAAPARANQGIELIALGRAPAALARLDAAARVFEAAGDLFWHAKCLGHRAEALTALGRYGDALDDLRLARQSLQALGARTEEWRAAIDAASVLLALGLGDEAVVVVDEIEAGLREAGVRHDLAAALLVRGAALSKTGRRAMARPALSESVQLYEEVGDRGNQARALLELSRLEPPERSLAMAGEAARLVDDRRWPGIACLVALRLAELRADDPQAAAEHLDEAARIIAAHSFVHLRQAIEFRRGILRLQASSCDAGIEILGRSLSDAERIGIGIRDEVLRTAYTSGLTEATDQLLAALLDRAGPRDLDRAALLSDRSKAGPLADVLRGAMRRPGRADDAAGQLIGELQAAYSTLFSAPGGGDKTLRARVEALERRVAVAQTLAVTDTASARPRPPARLPAVVCSVAYHVLGDDVVAFVTVGGELHVRRRVTGRRHLLALLDDLDAHLGAHAVAVVSEHAAARTSACRAVLQRLYLAVIAPVLDLLPARGPAAPLVVVPHGPLHRVPFQALHDGRHYLLADWVITVSPSLEVAAGALDRPARRGPALVMGVADETTPFVEEEARRVAEVGGDGSRLFVGPDATFENLRDHAREAGLVHLACHGLFRPGNPAFTSLRLADRWVRAADVADLTLDGAVLVLSGCETGRVGTGSTSGAAALAHGFLAAGARCVIVSRWLADDRSTAELMARMHERIAAGDNPPAALRVAQLALLGEHPHPFYWAPFTPVGAPSVRSEEIR